MKDIDTCNYITKHGPNTNTPNTKGATINNKSTPESQQPRPSGSLDRYSAVVKTHKIAWLAWRLILYMLVICDLKCLNVYSFLKVSETLFLFSNFEMFP